MAAYQTTHQKDSEYLDDWANRSVDRAYRAFPDLPEARVEQLAITRLCQGCNDKDAGKYPLPAILQIFCSDIDILCFTQTHLDTSISDSELIVDTQKLY